MNRNRNMRLMAGAMAVVIAAGLAGNCGYQRSLITAKAAEVDTEELQEVAENALDAESDQEKESEDAKKDQGTSKEESVYVKADPSGNVKNITVTEWLKNPGNGKLSDVSELEDIKNIKGDETYEVSGESGIDWQSEGNDIYYQGTTEKEIPVGVKISYKLDGKEISAEDLQGKDGKVEIHIQYTNNSKSVVDVDGKSQEMFTPFTMITAMMLPADEYQNVQIDNGKVISDADKEIVVGLGFPGLNENLKLEKEDFELPEDVTITADVKNASVGPTITMASTEFLQDLDLDEIDDFDDLSDSIDELKDATNQLVDGSKEAADGAKQLADGAGTLADGTKSLADGAGQLQNGTGALVTGTSSLVAKVPELVSGVGALDEGAGALQTGLGTLQASIDHKKQSDDDRSGLLEGAESLNAGITSYTQGIDDMKNTMTQGQMVEGAASVSTGAQAVSTGVQGVSQGLAGLKSQTDAVLAKTAGLNSAVSDFTGSVENIKAVPVVTGDIQVNAGNAISKDALKAALGDGYDETQIDEIMQAINGLNVTVTADQIKDSGVVSAQIDPNSVTEAQNAAAAVASRGTEAAAAAAAANGTAAALQGAMTGDGTAENPGLVAGANSLAAGAEKLASGVKAVKGGVDSLAAYNEGLRDGSGAIFAGMQQVSAGVSQLSEGAGELKAGTGQLAAGAGLLAEGASVLGEGVEALNSGAISLKSGTDQLNDGAGTLAEGASALAEGNQTLADGMSEYKTEAIDKLTDLFDGDIAKVTDRLKAMTDLGKEYKSFAGIHSNMSGTTKFIIETEGVDE
ncbi:MAG: hypothetical protein Q4C52_00480 [Eubacteriales bacterium]|nr:hypothetical protein [Eubacteriales bacterium]